MFRQQLFNLQHHNIFLRITKIPLAFLPFQQAGNSFASSLQDELLSYDALLTNPETKKHSISTRGHTKLHKLFQNPMIATPVMAI